MAAKETELNKALLLDNDASTSEQGAKSVYASTVMNQSQKSNHETNSQQVQANIATNLTAEDLETAETLIVENTEQELVTPALNKSANTRQDTVLNDLAQTPKSASFTGKGEHSEAVKIASADANMISAEETLTRLNMKSEAPAQPVASNININTSAVEKSIQSNLTSGERVKEQVLEAEQAAAEDIQVAEEVNLKPEMVLKESVKQANSNLQTSLASAGIQSQSTSQSHTGVTASYESQVSVAQVESLTTRQQTDSTVQTKQTLQLAETVNVYSKDFSKSVKEKVMVMVNQKLQFAEIRLDPPELGNMHVRVNLQNEVAAVQFLVQNQQAKEALEQQMGKLRDMLSESGVDVGDAHVAQQERQFGQSSENGDSNGRFASQEAEEESLDEMTANMHTVVKGSAVGVDFYA